MHWVVEDLLSLAATNNESFIAVMKIRDYFPPLSSGGNPILSEDRGEMACLPLLDPVPDATQLAPHWFPVYISICAPET